jgi:hypothetical protein
MQIPTTRQARRRAAPSCARHAALRRRRTNDLWCADFKDEFKLGNGRYCHPLRTAKEEFRNQE